MISLQPCGPNDPRWWLPGRLLKKPGSYPGLRRKPENLSGHAPELAVSGAHLNGVGKISAPG